LIVVVVVVGYYVDLCCFCLICLISGFLVHLNNKNMDDCWAKTRDKSGHIHPDPKDFPHGIKALADNGNKTFHTAMLFLSYLLRCWSLFVTFVFYLSVGCCCCGNPLLAIVAVVICCCYYLIDQMFLILSLAGIRKVNLPKQVQTTTKRNYFKLTVPLM